MLSKLLIGFVASLILCIVFVLVGLFFFALPYGGRRSWRFVEWEPQWFPMFRFIIGGTLGVAGAVWLYFKKRRGRNQ